MKITNFKKIAQKLSLCVLCFTLFACADKNAVYNEQIVMHKIGVAKVSQPNESIELMAGYFPKERKLATEAQMLRVDSVITKELTKLSTPIAVLENVSAETLLEEIEANSTKGILAYWVEFGKYHKVDLLLVPQVLYLSEKVGEIPTKDNKDALMLDFFLLDTREDGRLLKRAHFAEEELTEEEDALSTGGETQSGMSAFSRRQGDSDLESMVQDATQRMTEEFMIE